MNTQQKAEQYAANFLASEFSHMNRKDFLSYLEHRGEKLCDVLEGLSVEEKRELAVSLLMRPQFDNFFDFCSALMKIDPKKEEVLTDA